MKSKALKLHIKLYQDLQIYNENNSYRAILENELGLLNLTDYIFSTAEHLAPFNNINSTSFILPQFLLQDLNYLAKKDIVIMAGSLIPLDNFDYPRGFYYPDNNKKAFNLFPQKQKKDIVLLTENITYSELTNKNKNIFFEEFNFLKTNFTKKYKNFAMQQIDIMQNIIKNWNLDSGEVLIYSLEDVVKKILIKLLKQRDKNIEILFKNLDEFNRLTFNIFCAYNGTKGTILFWEIIDKKLYRLKFENNIFKGKNISFNLFDYEKIINLLEKNIILPNVVLSLFIVSYLPNIPISGGHRQYWYWRFMIKAFDIIFKNSDKSYLSQYGYNLLDFSQYSKLSKYGTGLELTKVNKKELFYDIFKLSLLQTTKQDGYYK